MAKALVPLANGCEEMEAVIIIDTLRRAGWEVVAVGLKPGPVTASRGVRLLPDTTWEDTDPASFDVVVLPGGNEGTENLSRDPRVLETLRAFHEQGKRVAAICAAPLVLQAAGLLAGRRVTCHPGAAAQLTVTERLTEPVVTDHTLLTSQGPGTAIDFALTLIAQVDGREKAEGIARAMVARLPTEEPATGRR
jgi:4-methyl-5(b-hydroxyethyl)-thiazole monophosphate biosynthesis